MSKKGVSIGAALRSRMQADDAQPVEQTTEPVIEITPLGTTESAASSPDTEPLEAFNTRLRRSLQRRLKVYSAQSGQKIQDVVNQALDEFLSSQND